MTGTKASAFLLFLVVTVSSVVFAEDLPFTEEVGARLAASLWKKTEASYDITLRMEIQTKPRSREEIRKLVESALAESVSPQELTTRINKETDRLFENEGKPRTFKERYVFSGGNVRLDQTLVEKPGDAEGPFQTTNISVPPKGDVEGYTCSVYHREKNAFVGKQLWHTTRFDQLGAFSQVGAGLKFFIGEIQKGADSKPVMTPDGQVLITPDQDKIAAIARGEGQYKIRLRGEVDEAGQNVHVVTVAFVADGKEMPGGRWTLDAQNYDICYRQETANKDGTWRLLSKADDFERVEGSEYMLPRKVSLFEYDKDGSLKERKDITIIKAVANATVDPELFAPRFPKDYTVTADVSGRAITIEPPEMTVVPLENTEEPADTVSSIPAPAPEPTAPVPPAEPREQAKGYGVMIWVLVLVVIVGAVGVLVASRRRK